MGDDLAELIERSELCGKKIGVLEQATIGIGQQSVECWWHNIQDGLGEVRGRLLAHPPVSIRSEVGMVVNEQRSILDNLASALARRNGANHVNDVYFPITSTKSGFYEELGKRKIRKLSCEDRNKIELLKPWLPSDENTEDGNIILFMLHTADRIRKHQNLLRWACIGGVHTFGSGYIGSMHAMNVKFDQLNQEHILAMVENVTCDIGVRIDLVYAEPAILDRKPVFLLLREFNKQISNILSSFV